MVKWLTESWATKAWLGAQLTHFVYAVSYGEQRPIQLGDPLVWYIANYWQYILSLGILAVPAIISRSAEPNSEDELPVKNSQDPCVCLLDNLANNLILDSNIWMNASLDEFFTRLSRELSRSSRQLVLFGPQFDEICNIKDRKPFASQKGRLARLALARIERMQMVGLLDVQAIDFETDKSAFADPKIVMLVSDLTKAGKDVFFVSDDRELRIRVRQFTSRNSGNLTVCDSKRLLYPNKRKQFAA